MSFHQLNFQKDCLRSLHQVPLNTNEAPQSSPTNINNASTITTAIGDSADAAVGRANVIENEANDISELECNESWTTMSEIDSQYSRNTNSIRFGGMELSMITDSDDSDNDDVGKGRRARSLSRIKKQQSLPPVGIVTTPTGVINTIGFNNINQQHHSLAMPSIIGGVRVISPRESEDGLGGLKSRPESQSSVLGQQRLKEAEAQVLHAREELARVTEHLDELQERHKTEVHELQEQLAAMNQKEQQHSEYENQLEIAQNEKLVAESKLDDAIQKLQLMESEKQKMAEEKRELQTKLKTTLKKVHFAEDQNSVLEFQVGEYKIKWENSLEQARQIESKLVTTRCVLENAIRQAEQTKEDCEMAVANAATKATKERSLREQHARKEQHAALRLDEEYQQNKQLRKEQLGLEKTVQSLEQERSGLQKQLETNTSRRNDVEANLSKANDECHRLTSERKAFEISIAVLESDHERQQKKLEESLIVQLEELRTSAVVLAAKDEMNEKKISEQEAEVSKRKADIEASQLKAQEQIQKEQQLLSKLKESRDKAREQKELSDFKMEELRQSIDALVAQDELNQKMLSEYKAEMLKLKTDSEAAIMEAEAKYDEEQRRSGNMEQQLLSKLKESRDKAREQKELSDFKMEELCQSIDALEAKDDLNQKMLSEYKEEMLKLKTDSEAAIMEAEAKYDEEQRRSGEMEQQLLSELKESRDKAQEQKESSHLELEEFRKSIDALVAKDELELEMLRKSIDALAVKDELNQKMLSEHEAEELKLKTGSKAAIIEAQAKYEEEQRRSVGVEQQLLSDLKKSHITAKILQKEKETLEEAISTLKKQHFHLNEELDEVNGRWKSAEAKTKQLDEEKRLLTANLTASRYSVLRLESGRTRVLEEREGLVESHKLELTKQRSILSSSREMERTLKIELDVVRNNQRSLEDDKADLENQLNTVGDAHGELVEVHDVSLRKFEAKTQELQLENNCLQKNALDFESAKSELGFELVKLREEHEILQQTQNETKLELHRRSKEQEIFSKASFDQYKLLESERNDLRDKVESLYTKEFELEEKLRTLVDSLEVSNVKLEEKEKVQSGMEDLLARERNTSAELEDEKVEFMKKSTSMSVQHAKSLLECEKKTTDERAKALRIEEDCINLKVGIALTTAEKMKLDVKLKAVKEELTQLQGAHYKSEEKIAELLKTQNESKISSERQIAGLMDRLQGLETEKKSSNRIRVELEETLNRTMASWDESKRALIEKENEFRNLEIESTKIMANVRDLEQQQALLVAENDAAAKEKNSIITIHSKRMKNHEVSAASLKEELEVTRMDMLETRREKEELQKRTEELYIKESVLKQKCNDTMNLLDNSTRRLEVAEKEKSLLQWNNKDQIRLMESVLAEKEKVQESLEASEKEKDELRSKYATAQSAIDAFEIRTGKLENERDNLEDEVRDAGKREEYLVSDLRSTKEENAVLKNSKEALILEHKHAVDCLETSKTEIASENDGLMLKLRSLKEQQLALTQQRDIADKRSFELNHKLEDCEAQNNKLDNERDDARLLIENLETSQELLRKQVENVEAAKAESENNALSNISALRRDNVRLETEQDLLRKQIEYVEAAKIESANAAHSNISAFKRDKYRVVANLEEAKGTIATLQTEVDGATKENSSLVTNIMDAKGTIADLEREADETAKENSSLNDNLKAGLKAANGTIITLQTEVNEAAKANSSLIANLKAGKGTIATLQTKVDGATKENYSLVANIKEAKGAIIALQTEVGGATKENSSLIANLKEIKGNIDALQIEVDRETKENSSLIANIKEATETIITLQTEAKEAAKENSFLIANLKDDLKAAKGTIANLQTEANEAAKENSCLIANLKDDLQETKGAFADLQTEANEAAKENSCLIANLKAATGTIANLQAETNEAEKENSFLIANLKDDLQEAKWTIANLQTEANEAEKENSCLIANLKDDLKDAKGALADLKTEVNEAAKENSCLIANLKDDLQDAKGTISNLQIEANEAAKENSCLIANLKDDLQAAKGTIAALQTEVNEAAKENSCLIANLKAATGTIADLQAETNEAEKENSFLIANLKDDLQEAKWTIANLQTEANEAEKENSCLIANLKDDLKDAKGALADLKTEVNEAAKENSCLIANLKDDLQEAKGTIINLQTEANEAAKENSCRIKNLKDDLHEAKVAIITLQTELDVALAKNCGHLSALEEVRGEIANTKKTMRGIELDRNRLRDEVENAKENWIKWEEKSRNVTLLRSVGEKTIRSLQNDILKEQHRTESIRNENQILSREKDELESRVGEAEGILTKELEAKKTRDESTHLKRELETKTLRRQLEETHSNSTHLREVVVRLESEKKAERSLASKQEYLRSVDGERIRRLKGELEEAVHEKVEQTKKTRKLAKLLKRTMNSVTRVYRMKMNIDMCYFDTITNQNREMPARAEYSGPVVGSKPHGAGVMKFECGDMYLGTFENGTFCQY
jgi:chromosome segregation ATPase